MAVATQRRSQHAVVSRTEARRELPQSYEQRSQYDSVIWEYGAVILQSMILQLGNMTLKFGSRVASQPSDTCTISRHGAESLHSPLMRTARMDTESFHNPLSPVFYCVSGTVCIWRFRITHIHVYIPVYIYIYIESHDKRKHALLQWRA